MAANNTRRAMITAHSIIDIRRRGAIISLPQAP
jgi:hypothetical protein